MSFGQVIITELADPNNNANARYIELYNAGSTDVDFNEGNGWQIDKYLNGNSGVNRSLDLTGTIAAGDFYVIGYDNTSGSFQSACGFAPDQLDNVSNGVAGSNEDDELRIGTSYSDVTPTTLSNADFISDSFKLYPNPSNSGFVNITSTGLGAIQANVFDMLGKQVVIDTTVVNGRLNVSDLNAGIYIVKLTQNNSTTTKKLIIQ